MEAPENQIALFSGLISSPEASRDRVPISARREEAWDSSEEAGVPYGWKCSGSSVLSARLGFSLRTFLTSSLAGLTPYCPAWKKRVTPRGRWWWVLGRSGRRTDGTGSGSLGGEWPTLHGADNADNPRRNGPTGNELGRAVTREWATPRASENENLTTRQTPSQLAGKRGAYLAVQALEWPTATARDWRSTAASPETHGKNARPLSEVVGLEWPTPKEVDGRPKGNAGLNRNSPGLDAMAKGGLLAEDSPNTNGSRRGSLNPDWVEALMGAPPGWTDLPERVSRELYAARKPAGKRSTKLIAAESA